MCLSIPEYRKQKDDEERILWYSYVEEDHNNLQSIIEHFCYGVQANIVPEVIPKRVARIKCKK
jgi:hypothetical protein